MSLAYISWLAIRMHRNVSRVWIYGKPPKPKKQPLFDAECFKPGPEVVVWPKGVA